MLLIISTPIGNLADISERALEALRKCDSILCEDTRHSQILLNHYAINKPLYSFHQFNEKKQQERILQELEEGRQIALISDAGTPLISDPGQALVRACIERQIPLSAIPGPCSPILALVLSGFNTSQFQFIGFLPRETGSLKKTLHRALFYQGTTIAFESPERLVDTLILLESLDPQRQFAIARELTKTYEECRRGTAQQLLTHFQAQKPRGEIILLIQEGPVLPMDMPVEELVSLLQELHGLSLKEAIKASAHLANVPKRDIYRQIHNNKEDI